MEASLHQNIIFSTNLWSFHQTWSKLAGIKISYEPTITGITLTEVGIYRNLWKIPTPTIIANTCLPSSRSRLLYIRPVDVVVGVIIILPSYIQTWLPLSALLKVCSLQVKSPPSVNLPPHLPPPSHQPTRLQVSPCPKFKIRYLHSLV